MRISFTKEGWQDYQHWVETDKKTLRRLNRLITASLRDPDSGEGKPEKLKRDLSGYWSRRINEQDRLVYTVEGETLLVVQCRYHY